MSKTDAERARRIGLNESVFREVNEQIEQLSERLGPSEGQLHLICECGNVDCAQELQMERDAYERMRADPLLFAVVPGHELEGVEELVGRRDAYHVVRKLPGVPAEVARETDPRGDDRED